VIKVNAQDRPALLNLLAYALFQSEVTMHSAHVATYGEHADFLCDQPDRRRDPQRSAREVAGEAISGGGGELERGRRGGFVSRRRRSVPRETFQKATILRSAMVASYGR